MERRISKRKLTETRVFLHHPELPPAPCVTRDLSADGVFVITPYAGRLKERAVLEMTFAVDLGNLTRLYDFVVTVTRVTNEGVALVIDRSRPAKSRAMPRRVDETHVGKAVGKAEIVPLRR
jgi:hypothetical protein